MEIPILILAAGSSSRMRGADKLLEDVAGVPLLRRQALAALAVGQTVIVTLPPDASGRRAALSGLDLTRVRVADAATGMAASLRAGIAALPTGSEGVLLLLADLPEIETADLSAIIAAFAADPAAIVRATSADGTEGHPVLFPARLYGELSDLTGDEGARRVLARHRGDVRLVALPGSRAVTDLDTPEDWAAWRAKTGL